MQAASGMGSRSSATTTVLNARYSVCTRKVERMTSSIVPKGVATMMDCALLRVWGRMWGWEWGWGRGGAG
jgi:hypothetical protein